MPALHRYDLNSLRPAFPVLTRATDFDRFVLILDCQRLVVVAHDVSHWEVSTAVILRRGEECFNGVWEKQRSSVGGDSWLDIAVEEGNWIGDGCYGTLVVDVSFRELKRCEI
jgi:hypothetical protein